MRTWITEHGREYDVPRELLEHPDFKDISWHNDMCPSFAVKRDESVTILCDHPVDGEREHPGGSRFFVNVDRREQSTVLETDDINMAIAKALEVAL